MPQKPIPCECGHLRSFKTKQCRSCWLKNPFKGREKIPLKFRFWKFVKKTQGCWIWKGSQSHNGYGVCHDPRMKSKKSATHRIAWELVHGKISDGLFVCHKCDNRICCRPSHLFIGTQLDNIQDMDKKGRRVKKGPKGESNSHAKLTETIVKLIRRLFKAGHRECDLIRNFGIPQATINHILQRHTWKHI